MDTKQDKGLISNLITGFKIVTFPLWKPLVASSLSVTGHAKDMESFYKYQKEGYDAFRESLLHARPALMEAFPLKKKGNMVWVDVGGGNNFLSSHLILKEDLIWSLILIGTARNLEYFSPEVIRKYFKAIYIVDISASLLEMAQKRYC